MYFQNLGHKSNQIKTWAQRELSGPQLSAIHLKQQALETQPVSPILPLVPFFPLARKTLKKETTKQVVLGIIWNLNSQT